MSKIQIRGLLAQCEMLHRVMWTEIHNATGDGLPHRWSLVQKQIQQNRATVEKLCQKNGMSPAELPTQSKQAYGWLRFLSDASAFNDHIATLMTVSQRIRKLDGLSKSKFWGAAIHVEMSNNGYLYRAQRDPKNAAGVKLLLNEGFCGAPERILDALLHLCFGTKRSGLDGLKAYAHNPRYLAVMQAMQLEVPEQPSNLNGQHYDLQRVFERVNAQYFAGQMPQPHLRWSRDVTERIMGTYQQRSDTVMISQTLDDAQVPEFVIDFVMYHELLHKQLGSRMHNGRRQVHFAEFKAAEKQYPRMKEAEAFLNAWAKKVEN